jgi:hypothetical protein
MKQVCRTLLAPLLNYIVKEEESENGSRQHLKCQPKTSTNLSEFSTVINFFVVVVKGQ